MFNNFSKTILCHKKALIIILFIQSLTPSFVISQIKKDTIKLKTFIVKDSLIKNLPFVATDISRTQIISTNTRDIGDFLRTVPNVAGVRKGGISIDPVIRGFKFSQINTILDNGIYIENGCPNRMDPVSSHVEADDIDKIEIIKGPFVLRYGSSLGGIINLITEQPQSFLKFQVHADASCGFETNWNGQKEHITLYGGNKKIYFLLSGGYKDYGNYKSGNLEGHDTTFNSSFNKYYYSAKLAYSIKTSQSIILSYSGIHSKDVMYPSLTMDEKSDDTYFSSADYQAKDLSNKIKNLSIKLFHTNVGHVMDNSLRPGYDTKQMIAEVNANTSGGRGEMTFRFNAHHLLAGIDYLNISKDGTRTMTMVMMGTSSTKRSNLWRNALIQNTGLYAEYSTFFSSFEFNANMRGDFNTATSGDTLKIIKNDISYYDDVSSQYLNVSVSAGLTKKINESLSISASLARGTRSPNMTERYIKLLTVGYDNFDYLGNPQLKPETNNEGDLTLQYSKENIGSVYLNGFYSYVQNYITTTLLPASVITPQTSGVPGVKQYINADHVTLRGFEFGYTSPEKCKLGGSAVASYTYAVIPEDIKYIYTGTQITGEVNVKYDALPEIPPFETSLSLYYKFLKGKLIPKLTARIVADQNHVSHAFYETSTPGFGILSFAVKCKVGKYAEINAGVNNIFDRAYYEHLNRKIVGSAEKLYEPGRVFFINLFIRI